MWYVILCLIYDKGKTFCEIKSLGSSLATDHEAFNNDRDAWLMFGSWLVVD